ncbi:hypothetical protein HYH03_016237 [Edaphochlamys debaryana]|uniref:U-box domain-containing protein n=1 Tax=Edaphochlamys debaryana TaxID=47281 RepID=A0A836BRN8_9CHLO|nr:hypothetical protein HYH03_016237 [Edaphochlamys debaryana]|eukprot:KAG2485034.1 hypothetical protein HYH03_016237 [Edaphochlamys debaryana]
MLASGWLSTRIHSILTDVGFALHALSASLGDEASAPASALRSAGYELMRLCLPSLDARAELCASMWAELEEAAECPEGLGEMRAQAGAWRVIRGVLVEASGAVPSLDDAEELMRDPVVNALGFTYERAAIEAWLRNHDTDPETRQRLPNKDLAPNWTVKGLIRDWLEETGRTYEDWRNLDELEGMDEQADGLDEHDEQEAAVEAREPRARPHPRLLEYVTLAPGPRLPLDARRGPLARGQYGIVIAARDCKDVQQVRSLHKPFKAWWYNPAALVRLDPSAVPPHRRLILPPQRPGSAVPVTHFTAQEGMLVRRGYDWLDPADRNGLGDETGVLLSADPGARNHRVLWAGGAVECYRTGHGNHFELQHLQVAHPGCGVPVCAAHPVVPGSGVVLGAGERDGRVSSDLGSLELPDGGAGRASGWVAARWADGQRTHHLTADPEGGHELHHCPREGEPVTVYTAQAELRVTRGRDWRWDDADGCGREGRLVRPLGLGGDFVWWEVAMYEADPVNGHVSLGTPMVLAESGGGAPDGALRPGKPGVVAETLGVRVKVLHVPTGVECW